MASRSHDASILTVARVAKQLNVHINTLRRWTNSGILRAYRIGSRADRRFKGEDIKLLLEKDKVLGLSYRSNSLS